MIWRIRIAPPRRNRPVANGYRPRPPPGGPPQRLKSNACPQTVLPSRFSSPVTAIPSKTSGITTRRSWTTCCPGDQSAAVDHSLPRRHRQALLLQKHHTAGLELVDSVKLKEDSGINAHYLVVGTRPACWSWSSSMPWVPSVGSHGGSRPRRPGGVRFRPRPRRAIRGGKTGASDIRKLLGQLELESFLRVSGGKGLHVVVPSARGATGT